jgi:hypothetical protein
MSLTDYPDWQTPLANATQIAGTGVPLLRFTNNLAFSAAMAVPPPGSVTLLNATTINQPGYEIAIVVNMATNAATMPFLHVALEWGDSTSNLQVARRDVVMAAGSSLANALTYYLRGPMHGDEMVVKVVNLDPTVSMNVAYTVNATSHVYEQDQALQYAYGTAPPTGYNNPGGVPTANLIAYTAAALATMTSSFSLCALYSGDVILNIDNVQNAQPVTVQLFDPSGYITGTVGGTVFGIVVAAAGSDSIQMTLPYAPLLLKVSNTSAVTITPVVTLIGQQH